MTHAMKNYWGSTICISLLDAIAARYYLQTSSIFCPATQDCFGSSCTISIYMTQLFISSSKIMQLSNVAPHNCNQETSNANSSCAVVVIPWRFPHRQNLCSRPPSASEDSTRLHLTNCIRKITTLIMWTLECQNRALYFQISTYFEFVMAILSLNPLSRMSSLGAPR